MNKSITIIDGKIICEECNKELVKIEGRRTEVITCPKCGSIFELRYDQYLNFKIHQINYLNKNWIYGESELLEFHELVEGKLYKRVFDNDKLDFVRIRVDNNGFLEVRYKDRGELDFEPLKVSKQLKEMRFMEVDKDEI